MTPGMADLADARAGAKKVAEIYGLTLTIYRDRVTGHYHITNGRTLATWDYVECHQGKRHPPPEHGSITIAPTP